MFISLPGVCEPCRGVRDPLLGVCDPDGREGPALGVRTLEEAEP